MATGHLSVVTEADCRLLLGERTVGRVAWCLPDGPRILPVTYFQRDGAIVFRTRASGALASLDGRLVAFEVDDVDPTTETGWSVLVRGRCHRTQDDSDSQTPAPQADGPQPWAPGHDDLIMEIIVQEITGRSVSGPDRDH